VSLPSLSPLTASRKEQIRAEDQIRSGSRPVTPDAADTDISPGDRGRIVAEKMRAVSTDGRAAVADKNADNGWAAHSIAKVGSHSQGTASPLPETAEETQAREAKELDEMLVCGVGLGELLRWQKEDETERGRMVTAGGLMEKALVSVEAKHLAMIAKLKAPPLALCATVEMLLLLLHEEVPPVRSGPVEPGKDPPLETTDVWPLVQPMLQAQSGHALHARLRAFQTERLDPETMELLEPYLLKLTHTQVRQTVGVIASLFTWVSAAAVLGGSPHARLLSESRPDTRSSSPTARSNQTSPQVARPKYRTNEDAQSQSSNQSPDATPSLVRSPAVSRNSSISQHLNSLDQLTQPPTPQQRLSPALGSRSGSCSRGLHEGDDSPTRTKTPVLQAQARLGAASGLSSAGARASPSAGSPMSLQRAASHSRLQRPHPSMVVSPTARRPPGDGGGGGGGGTGASPAASGAALYEDEESRRRPPPLGRPLSSSGALGRASPASLRPPSTETKHYSSPKATVIPVRVSPLPGAQSLSVSGPSSLLGGGGGMGGGMGGGEASAETSGDVTGAEAIVGARSVDDIHPLKFLGAGSFANVFMCRDATTGKLFAMKSILKALALKQNKHRQVIAEKEALVACKHHCIIAHFSSFADAQHLYLLMELALGGELFALMDDRGRLDEQQCCFYAGSVCLALQHLHANGFIYRDLKPENILLDHLGYLKLADLGLAKKAARAWTLVGTPEYVAPEVLRGEGASQAVDWWQLGVLIFEMLTASLPFESDDDASLFVAIRKGVYEWPSPPDTKVPPPSETVKALVGALLRQALPGDADFEASPDDAGEPRLGSCGRDALELMEHAWFRAVDWEALATGDVPVPFVPQLMSEDDDSNFGPMAWRGKPICGEHEYDNAAWGAFFAGW